MLLAMLYCHARMASSDMACVMPPLCAWPIQCPQFHGNMDASMWLPSCLYHYANTAYNAVLELRSSWQKNWPYAGCGLWIGITSSNRIRASFRDRRGRCSGGGRISLLFIFLLSSPLPSFHLKFVGEA